MQAFQHRNPFSETLFEVKFATHGRLGNFGDLIAGSFQFGEFVDDFRLNEWRIHVEREESPISAVNAFPLKCDIDAQFVRECKQSSSHFIGGMWLSANPKFNT